MTSSVDQIKERLNIVDVISSYIKLERAGVNLKARCPFHNEKTPSFFVSPSRDTYHCFGCEKGGDIFSFVQDIEGVPFLESLHLLAERAGIVLEDSHGSDRGEKKRLYGAMEEATIFFENELVSTESARAYLKKRGLAEETIKEFRIGFAPNEWRLLTSFLRNKGFTDSELVKAGLAIVPEKGGTPYDRFRGRIMFPIADPSGKVIAFSGRVLPISESSTSSLEQNDKSSLAKYVNSPETPLFSKSKTLYAYDKAKTHIRQSDSCILVEGQMDVVLSHQAGIKNAVAVSGTALTEEHLIVLNRMTQNLILAFDADLAGIHASERGISPALAHGFNVRILKLPKDSDPADMILVNPGSWVELIQESKHVVDFYLAVLTETFGDKRELGKHLEKEVLPFVAKIQSTMERAHFVSRIAEAAGIGEDPIWESLAKIHDMSVVPRESVPQKKESEASSLSYEHRHKKFEERLLGAFVWQKKCGNGSVIMNEIEKAFDELIGEPVAQKIEKLGKSESEKLLFEAEAYYGNADSLEADIRELIVNLKEHVLKGRLMKAMDDLRRAEREKDEDLATQSMQLCKELSGEINKITSLRLSEKV